MEDILYKAAMAYISANTTPITTRGLEVPKHQAWWTDQVADALKEKDNQTLPFDMPAIFYEFNQTKYAAENVRRVKATGEVTLHLAQWRVGKDGIQGAAAETAFNLILKYAGALVDILHGNQLPCAATLILANIQRDHNNNAVLHEKITFTWSATKKLSNL